MRTRTATTAALLATGGSFLCDVASGQQCGDRASSFDVAAYDPSLVGSFASVDCSQSDLGASPSGAIAAGVTDASYVT